MEAFCHAAPFGHLLTTLQAGNGSAQGDLLQDTDLAREPVKEPAKRWRNWWRVIKPYYSSSDKRVRWPGDVYHGTGVWPTREVAEQKAIESMSDRRTAPGIGHSEYVCALPDGETP